MKVIIIEDEPLTADDLAETILKINDKVEILAKLYSVKESVEWIRNNDNPDLIFCDIQLGDGLSFDIFKAITCTSPVIFCTAYDEYALNAFKANGIDYILKPFSEKTIENALAKYKTIESNFSRKVIDYKSISELIENNKVQKNSILIYYKDEITPVNLSDIAVFYLDKKTHIYTFKHKEYIIKKTLEELEKITNNDFFRVNRQYLINRTAIKSTRQLISRKLSLNLNIPYNKEIIVNKEKVVEFLNWLSIN